ncbi:MAG: transglycosylase domain-containing protein [Clostridia bacterium]|nr:transglycosylase domain-containing protein [Clostridia bacterium]
MKENIYKKKKRPIILKIFLGLLIAMLTVCIVAVLSAVCVLYTGSEKIDADKLMSSTARITVRNTHGGELSLPATYDKNISAQDIPENIKKAFISLEDKRFYKHHGLDYVRIGGAMLHNISAGKMKEGGSTISQQLIKNTHLSAEKSFNRKIEEARLAIQLERQYSKDDILAMYLNVLYFGSGVYGVKNASRVFFDKDISQLSVAESAILAGIVKSPTKYNPINNYDNCMERKDVVLGVMRKCEAISENEYNEAKNCNIIIKKYVNENNSADKYLIAAMEESCDILNLTMQQLVYGDYTIDTYMDNNAMNALTLSVGNEALYIANEAGNKPDGMGIIADNNTCGIKAFYANCDYSPRTTRRQPASAIKPLACYLPAIEKGIISPASIIKDEAINMGGYQPQNYGGEYYGNVSVRYALEKSLNIPAVKIMDAVGIDECCSMLKELDINVDSNDYNYSTALGGMTYGVTAIELIGGYMAIANGGLYSRPTFIKCIYDSDGNIVYQHICDKKRVFSTQTAYLMTDMLSDVVSKGTAVKMSDIGCSIAAKTGTVACQSNSNFNTDAYNVSYTSIDTMAIWQGNLCGKSDYMLSGKVTGGGCPTLIASSAYKLMYNNVSEIPSFSIPDGIVQVNLDKIAYDDGELILASDNAPQKSIVTEIFSTVNMPMLKDTTYDNPCLNDYNIEIGDGIMHIDICANPRLSYRIIKQSLISRQQSVADLNSGERQYRVDLEYNQGLFSDKVIIVPYYLDDNNIEHIGYPVHVAG